MKILELENVIEAYDPKDFASPFVIPTETVYGLAARADDPKSLQKIFSIKGRPRDNPLILHIGTLEMLDTIVTQRSKMKNMNLIRHFWPGPLTIIFEAKSNVSEFIKSGVDSTTVGVRMPRSDMLRILIEHIGVPLAAPSANKSGRPSPTTLKHAISDLGEEVNLYINGGVCEEGLESTIFGYINDVPTILRLGAVTREDIENVLGRVVKVKSRHTEGEKVICPGQKYKHYAPSVPLLLFRSHNWRRDMEKKALEALTDYKRIGVISDDNTFELNIKGLEVINYFLGSDIKEHAKNIFSGLREMERKCDIIFVSLTSNTDIGLAILDRLSKAASEIIH